jgi:hypothetical protein
MRLGFLGRLYWAARTRNRRRAWCLVVAAIASLPLCCATAARAETLPELPNHSGGVATPQLSTSFGTNDSNALSSLTVAQLQAVAEKKLNRDLVTKLIGPLPEWVQRIEVTGNFNLAGWRGMEVLTVQPLWQSDDKRQVCFTQLSVVNYRMFDQQRFAGNAGLGYRRLLMNDKLLVGGNSFFDYEFLRGHKRTGIGAEVKFGPLDFTANGYLGLNERSVDDGSVERVPNGFDLELGSQVPYLPWARVYGKYYVWDQRTDDGHRVHGAEVSGEANLYRYLSVEAGARQDVGGSPEGFMMLRVKLNRDTAGGLFEGPIVDSKIFADRDMSKLMLGKVRRENRIILVRSSAVQGKGGVTVTVGRAH